MKQAFPLLILASMFFLGSCKKTSTTERPVTPTAPTLPQVTTLPITIIQVNNATSGFSIVNADTITIVERGIVWNTDSLPTTTLTTKVSTTQDTASFEFAMTGLLCSTKYYVRAYVVTSSHGTIYGNQLEFTTNSGDISYSKELTLSNTVATDTTIEQGIYLNMAWPRAGATYMNNVPLPQGVHFYVRFDSVHHNIRCDNGISSRLVNAGDTVHFGVVNWAGARPGIFIIGENYVTGMGDVYTDSEAKFSIHVGGMASPSETSYYCKYLLGGYGLTNTTYQRIYEKDTTACRTLCTF